MDPGNLSKMERGRLDPPKDHEILNRFCSALGYQPEDLQAVELRDLAAIQAGRFPADLMSDPDFLRQAPAILRALRKEWARGVSQERLIGRIAACHEPARSGNGAPR